MKFLLFLICALPLFGAQIVGYNIYDRNERVDIMLSFDSAFGGEVIKQKDKNFTLLTLKDATYATKEKKGFKSKLLDKMEISSDNNNTYIIFQSKEDIEVLPSIADNLGFRIRIVPKTEENLSQSSQALPTPNLDLVEKPLQADIDKVSTKQQVNTNFDYLNYVLIISILVLLLLVLWWFKRRVAYKNVLGIKDFNISFQRPLDKNNQFVIIDYNEKRYVLILGSSNLLLESYPIEKEKENNEFDSTFEENKKKIQNIIKTRKNSKS
ncbi:hypothetical protein FMM58_04205 [Campylobacter sp. LR291e]|uniref:hypothetical protein n=1 Tax=unclassified Campylobacter TaxID=2593542 RepID=UPI001237E2C7|nr:MULTISPECIES: hypothetical protein [unclassified Campylobacter]KAA6227122.1 hypothetical protein FMM54_02995 [Campylobacter sp. LR185c]KAA6227481.1 hypothetical protein FMM55_02785 [Campylobacter sp. LR196d]KAA6230898.1 hypothetical protein FMM58_04205 [Campylobacter sp. LR291e]KAA6233532.1 hypothetical protein FMM56_03210 [Campylobacter sp. LR264d]KAA8603817.1 hypothetical protein CGP82_05330 [Campylobacter sp. LR185c]